MNTLLFPVLFLLLGVILLWIIIGIKGWFNAKMWLINIVTFFVILLWFGVRSYMGWPADEHLPEQIKLAGMISDEPKSLYIIGQKHDNYDLFTHSWYDFVFYKPDDSARMYKISYSKEAHKNLEQAMEIVQKGGYVVLSRKDMDGKKVSDKAGGESITRNADFMVYELPPSKLIKKPTP